MSTDNHRDRTHHHHRRNIGQTKEEQHLTLSKTLCYLLRHGAAKEGLTIYKGGYVLMEEILALPQMRRYTARDLEEVVTNSVSVR